MASVENSEEQIQLLIEVTKTNIEVTKNFTEITVKQNSLLEDINTNIKKLVQYLDSKEGLSKTIIEERQNVSDVIAKKFDSFVWKTGFIITLITTILGALILFFSNPVTKELKEEVKNLREVIQEYHPN